MRRSQFGGIGSAIVRGLIFLFVLALLGAVAYLLSDLNQRHYRLAHYDGTLVIERGRFFPLGFTAYTPESEALRQAYAPIVVPTGEIVDTGVPYDDRSEVDRALYGRLAGWAKERLDASDPEVLALGIGYVKRLEILPGLSEEQRHELRSMRADAALRQGEGLMQGVALTVRQARLLFEQALELGCQHPDRARQGLTDIGHKLEQLDESASSTTNDTPALTPSAAQPKRPEKAVGGKTHTAP